MYTCIWRVQCCFNLCYPIVFPPHTAAVSPEPRAEPSRVCVRLRILYSPTHTITSSHLHTHTLTPSHPPTITLTYSHHPHPSTFTLTHSHHHILPPSHSPTHHHHMLPPSHSHTHTLTSSHLHTHTLTPSTVRNPAWTLVAPLVNNHRRSRESLLQADQPLAS